MKRFSTLLLFILLLAGCAAAPTVTTEPPWETTAPPVTTAPPETTQLPETTIPIDPAEAEIRAVAEQFLTAYEENCYLYTDNAYDHLTILDADADATVSYGGKSVSLSEFHENIQLLHDEEAYWKEARQEQGIYRHDFEATCHFGTFTYDGDTVTVSVSYAMSFTYDDQPGITSGGRDDFELLLVCVDGTWLVAGVSTIGA